MLAMLGCVVIMLCALASDALGAAGDAARKRNSEQLPPSHYYTMKPFTLPIMAKGRVVEHFTLVVALELADKDKRSAVFHLTPRLRDAMYQMLYQMVTFRRKGSPIPSVNIFKQNLSKVALKLAGTDLVTSLVVQQAFSRRLR